MGEEVADHGWRQVDDRQAVHGFLELGGHIGQQQDQHVAIAGAGIAREVALPHQILKRKRRIQGPSQHGSLMLTSHGVVFEAVARQPQQFRGQRQVALGRRQVPWPR